MKLLEFDYSVDESFLETGKIIDSFENQEKSYIDCFDEVSCYRNQEDSVPRIWMKRQKSV